MMPAIDSALAADFTSGGVEAHFFDGEEACVFQDEAKQEETEPLAAYAKAEAAEMGDSLIFPFEEEEDDGLETAMVEVRSASVSYTDWEKIGESRGYRLHKSLSSAGVGASGETDTSDSLGEIIIQEAAEDELFIAEEVRDETDEDGTSTVFSSGKSAGKTDAQLQLDLLEEDNRAAREAAGGENASGEEDLFLSDEDEISWDKIEETETGLSTGLILEDEKQEAVNFEAENSFEESLIDEPVDWTTAAVEDNLTAWVPESTAADGEVTEEVSSYYTSADGIVRVSTVTESGNVHTGMYFFDADGTMLLASRSCDGSTYYFQNYGEAVFDEGLSASEKTPWNSSYGQALEKSWRWDRSQGRFYYYNGLGRYMTVARLTDNQKKLGKYTGYFRIRKGYYFCLDEEGSPRTGTIKLTGQDGTAHTYYFEPKADGNGIPGVMFYGGWMADTVNGKERWRYFYKTSSRLGQLYEHGNIVTRLDPTVKGTDQYLLSPAGYICKNASRKVADGRMYHTDESGRILKSRFVVYKNRTYYVLSNGARAQWKKQWHRAPGEGNRMYYFGSLGQVVRKTGWQKVTKVTGELIGWFYFDSNGNHKMGEWVDNHTRYLLPDGRAASGIAEINGVKYYFLPSTSDMFRGGIVPNASIEYKGKNYFTDAGGALIKEGWITRNGRPYFVQDYKLARNTFASKPDGSFGFLDNDGDFHGEGWYIENDYANLVHYIEAAAGGFVRNDTRTLNGLTYYFDSNGYRINDVSDRVPGPYYLTVDRVNGVMTIYNYARTAPVKSVRITVGAPETETPLGTYTCTPYLRWTPLMGPTYGQYGTHVVSGIYIHSIPCNTPSIYDVPRDLYYLLGYPGSHGCIRVCVADAKWIFYNCSGAPITIFDGNYNTKDSMKGPLGKPPLIEMYGTQNFDPTDPEVR